MSTIHQLLMGVNAKIASVPSVWAFTTIALATTGTGRWLGGMAWSGNKLSVFGGYNGSNIAGNNTSTADIANLNSWSAGITGHPQSQRFGYGYVGNLIVSISGLQGAGEGVVSTNCYGGNPSTPANWTAFPSANLLLAGNVVVSYNSKLISIGGWDGSNTYYNIVKTYSAGNWTQTRANGAVNGFTQSMGMSVVADDAGNLYLMGGYNNVITYHGQVWKSTDGGANWTQLTVTGAGFGSRGWAAAWFADGYIHILGGKDNVNVLATYFKSANGEDWEEVNITNPNWSARLGQTVCMKDGKAYVHGGYNLVTYFDELYRIG